LLSEQQNSQDQVGAPFWCMFWRSLLIAAAAAVVAVGYTYQASMSQLAAAEAASAAVSMIGKHAVVVGGTSGIGHGIALRLAQAGCSVTIVGRSASRGVAIVESMATTTEEQKHAFLKLDAFSLKACGALAGQLGAADKPLDLLVLSLANPNANPTPALHPNPHPHPHPRP